jgi:predicted Fe-Mo cluster-binding NifX family protein
VVQFLSNHQVGATITGKYGPTAYKALKAAGIKGFEAAAGTPEELYQRYAAGKLKQVSLATGRGRHRQE